MPLEELKYPAFIAKDGTLDPLCETRDFSAQLFISNLLLQLERRDPGVGNGETKNGRHGNQRRWFTYVPVPRTDGPGVGVMVALWQAWPPLFAIGDSIMSHCHIQLGVISLQFVILTSEQQSANKVDMKVE
jgi:hypothetical protein